MPLYEYKCDSCGDVFEVMQKFTDAPLTQHATCGGAVHRLISAPAFQFKGSGWYVTDYAKGGHSNPNGGSKKEEGGAKKDEGAAKTSSSSSDSGSKPATAPAATTSSDSKSSS